MEGGPWPKNHLIRFVGDPLTLPLFCPKFLLPFPKWICNEKTILAAFVRWQNYNARRIKQRFQMAAQHSR